MSPHIHSSFMDKFGFVHTFFKDGVELVTDSYNEIDSPVEVNDGRDVNVSPSSPFIGD